MWKAKSLCSETDTAHRLAHIEDSIPRVLEVYQNREHLRSKLALLQGLVVWSLFTIGRKFAPSADVESPGMKTEILLLAALFAAGSSTKQERLTGWMSG